MDGFQRSRQAYQPVPTDEALNRPKGFLQKSILADYGRKIQSAPREVILSRSLLLSCVMYATAAIPLSKSRLPYPTNRSQGPCPYILTVVLHSMGPGVCIHNAFSKRVPAALRDQFRLGWVVAQFHFSGVYWRCSRGCTVIPV